MVSGGMVAGERGRKWGQEERNEQCENSSRDKPWEELDNVHITHTFLKSLKLGMIYDIILSKTVANRSSPTC